MGAALEAQAPKATLESQLEGEYKLTTPTADNTDIVTMGSVLILQKKGFSAGSVSSKVTTQNTYKDGQIKSGAATAVRRFGALPGIGYIPGVGTAAGTAAGAAGGPPFGEPQGANPAPCGGAVGRMSKAGGDMKITPLRPMPSVPQNSEWAT